MNRKDIWLLIVVCFIKVFISKTGLAMDTAFNIPRESSLVLYQCSQPMGSIDVMILKCEAPACQGEQLNFGTIVISEIPTKTFRSSLANLLIHALTNTNCFNLTEKKASDKFMTRMSKKLKRSSPQPLDTFKTPDFIVIGTISKLELRPRRIPGSTNEITDKNEIDGEIRLDLKIVKGETGKVLTTKSIEGRAENWPSNLSLTDIFGTSLERVFLTSIKNTPLEEALGDILAKSVPTIIETVGGLSRYKHIKITKKEFFSGKKERLSTDFQRVGTLQQSRQIQIDQTNKTPYNGLIREDLYFEPYNRLLWSEDFSGCSVIPTSVRVIKGRGECVKHMGQKWFSSIRGDVIFEKVISNFDPTTDWCFEAKVFFSFKNNPEDGQSLTILIGNIGSPISLQMATTIDNWKVGDLLYENFDILDSGLPWNLSGRTLKIALKKSDNVVHFFLNGKRYISQKVNLLSLSGLPPKIIVKLEGNDLERGIYALITDLRLTVK